MQLFSRPWDKKKEEIGGLFRGKWVWAIVFEFFAQHLLLFPQLLGSGRSAFAFIVASLAAGGLPTFESFCHGVSPRVSTKVNLEFLGT